MTNCGLCGVDHEAEQAIRDSDEDHAAEIKLLKDQITIMNSRAELAEAEREFYQTGFETGCAEVERLRRELDVVLEAGRRALLAGLDAAHDAGLREGIEAGATWIATNIGSAMTRDASYFAERIRASLNLDEQRICIKCGGDYFGGRDHVGCPGIRR